MAAQDEQHLYSLPLEQVPIAPDDYNGLINKPKLNGYTIEGDKTAADYDIVIPTKVSDLQNDLQFAKESQIPTQISQLANNVGYTTQSYVDTKFTQAMTAIPTKTSELTNDKGFITQADVPTKTSELTNDSDFTTKEYVDAEIAKLRVINGAVFVTAMLATEQFTSTFDNFATNIQTKLSALKAALSANEFIEITALRINTIGNLKPSATIIISPSTNIASLVIDWQGVSYNNNVLQAIDIVNKKVLSLTMTNDTNNDAFVSYFNDTDTYTFTIEYNKYETLHLTQGGNDNG